ncbi:uncharacterized protein LOC134282982 [Saccostrea cucullata]|uniref:uncharacterized protein LOC134282982 n=1 Tax=Saccostrea cuccullata TaxID=36930 RepID=UPI002ED6C015
MAEKRLPDFVGPGLSAFRQKRFRTGSSEISNVHSATQSASSGVESDSCIGKLGNNEMQEDSDDEDSYTEKTEDDENQEDSDDDDADRSLLYCILLSKDGSIDLNNDDWYERLTDIRSTYKMKHRSREEDILAIQSMIEGSDLVTVDRNIVKCYVNSIGDKEDDRFYNCLTFSKDYDKFLKVTPTEVLRECLLFETNIQEKIMSSVEISDIVLNFGLDFVRFFNTGLIYNEEYYKGLDILNLPCAVNHMVNLFRDFDVFSEFKEYVEEIMKREQKSLESLNLNSLLGSYLIGRETGEEKALDNLTLSYTKWNILVSILMSETYSLSFKSPWEEILTNLRSAFPLLNCESRNVESDIAELTDIHKVLQKERNSVSFISDDVRHQVMSYFVKNCLITDEDYGNYIKLSSADSLLDYARPWWYVDDVINICHQKVLFLPRSLDDLFIQRLGLDALRHVMVECNELCEDTIETAREAIQRICE